MAVGLIRTLLGRHAAAWPAIQSGVRRGLSIQRIGSAVRGGGFRIANSALRTLVGKEREIWAHGQAMRYLNFDKAPNVEKLPEALHAITAKYSYVVRVKGTVIETGQPITQNITVVTNRLLTRGEIERNARRVVEQRRSKYQIVVEDTLLISGLRAGVEGVL